jgi:hypothetical protein
MALRRCVLAMPRTAVSSTASSICKLNCSDPAAGRGPLGAADVAAGRARRQVAGYIKAVSGAGAFVALAADLDARVRLSNLADGFVPEPAAAFPVGRLVRGRVLAVDGGRCGPARVPGARVAFVVPSLGGGRAGACWRQVQETGGHGLPLRACVSRWQ